MQAKIFNTKLGLWGFVMLKQEKDKNQLLPQSWKHTIAQNTNVFYSVKISLEVMDVSGQGCPHTFGHIEYEQETTILAIVVSTDHRMSCMLFVGLLMGYLNLEQLLVLATWGPQKQALSTTLTYFLATS